MLAVHRPTVSFSAFSWSNSSGNHSHCGHQVQFHILQSHVSTVYAQAYHREVFEFQNAWRLSVPLSCQFLIFLLCDKWVEHPSFSAAAERGWWLILALSLCWNLPWEKTCAWSPLPRKMPPHPSSPNSPAQQQTHWKGRWPWERRGGEPPMQARGRLVGPNLKKGRWCGSPWEVTGRRRSRLGRPRGKGCSTPWDKPAQRGSGATCRA